MVEFNAATVTLWSVAAIVLLQPCRGYKEISSLLDAAKGFSSDEIKALRPLFDELQLQYDFITTKMPENEFIHDKEFQQQYDATIKDFEQQLDNMFPPEPTVIYNISLPTAKEIMGIPNFSLMTREEQVEFLDLQAILQDTLDDAQYQLKDLVATSLRLEVNLMKHIKRRIASLIFKAIKISYKAAAKVSRAAYCAYYHLPQLNKSLHSLYEGVDCYLFTTSLIAEIQNETYQTIKTVKKSAVELAAVYKKIAKRKSLVGKILSAILNINKIGGNILKTIRTTKSFLDKAENQLPLAANEVANCAPNVIIKIPFVVQTVSNVKKCVLFVDNTNHTYDFMKPEAEYYKEVNNTVLDDELYAQ